METPRIGLVGLVVVATLAGACGRRAAQPCAGVARAGETRDCTVPGWPARDFTLEIPAAWDGRTALPLVVAFHGGGGNRRSTESVTCPGGDLTSAGCLSAVAKAAGFAVVRPDGTGARLLPNVRTWNAGGGTKEGWNCTSANACKSGVDDMRYFDELLAEVERQVPIDPRRVHATGLSNGGAISHRLACERGARIASIVTVGGENQLAATGGACAGGIPVLEIHGTADPCWTYEESATTCAGDPGIKAGVATSIDGWRQRNGCSAESDEAKLPDRDPGDGTSAVHVRWHGCKAAVELIRVDGGGHTWPSGAQYLAERKVGRVTHDFGSDVVVDFFRAHPK